MFGKKNPAYTKVIETLPKLDGKVFAITGTTSGTGFAAAEAIGKLGGEVLLLNRKSSRAEDSLKKLKESVPDGKFVPFECDLQDYASVRNAANEIKSKYDQLFCLANNAGVMALDDYATKDGYDVQMQTNHLSHFLLTAELYPLLEAEANANGEARIVNHSSLGQHRTANKMLEQKYLEKNGGNLGGSELKFLDGPNFERYFQTKLANSVFTYALDEKLKAKKSNIRAICAHPGGSSTSLADGLKFGFFQTLIFKGISQFLTQSAADGSAGLLKGMADPTAESGTLYGPKSWKGDPVVNFPKTYENDPESMKMLWKVSEESTGCTFNI